MKKIELDKMEYLAIKKIVECKTTDARMELEECIREIEEKRDDLRKAEAKLRTMHLAIARMEGYSQKLKSYI